MEPLATNPTGMEGGATASPAVGLDAESLATQAGGNPTGRPRRDGLVPGSPEAALADRERDRERKRKLRARARGVIGGLDAPPLPSLAHPGDAPVVSGPPVPDGVPWEPGMLAGVTTEIIAAVERWQVNALSKKAAKVPGAPADFADTVKADAAWDGVSKSALETSAPRVISKWMNKTGVSSEHSDEIILAAAIVKIGVSHSILSGKLDKLIKEAKPQPLPAPAPNAPV